MAMVPFHHLLLEAYGSATFKIQGCRQRRAELQKITLFTGSNGGEHESQKRERRIEPGGGAMQEEVHSGLLSCQNRQERKWLQVGSKRKRMN